MNIECNKDISLTHFSSFISLQIHFISAVHLYPWKDGTNDSQKECDSSASKRKESSCSDKRRSKKKTEKSRPNLDSESDTQTEKVHTTKSKKSKKSTKKTKKSKTQQLDKLPRLSNLKDIKIPAIDKSQIVQKEN